MPRTPLLQRLADAAAAARRSDASIDRRTFLGLTAAGVALAACGRTDDVLAPRALAPAKGTAPGLRVAVIGAGLAGLTAAYRLKQAGISATVYEASARLGGRCSSLRGFFADAQIAEHGGELIDQGHTAIRQLAQELGLPLDNMLAAEANGTEPLYWFGNAPYTFDDATRDMKAVWQGLHRDYVDAGYPTLYTSFTARGQQLDRTSVAEWIDQRVPGGRASRLGRLLEVAYVIEYGADATAQSALNLVYLLGTRGQGQLRIFGPSNEKYHVRGGNDLIVQRLAAVAGQIQTGAALTSISRNANGTFALGFAGGAAGATADHVVLALPFSVLRTSVDYAGAGFSAVKKAAIAGQGMGANNKLNVQFSTRHWRSLGCNGDTFADRGYQATWEVSRGQAGTSGILVGYSGGSAALAQGGKTPAQLVQTFLSQIEPVLPGISARYANKVSFDDWTANPWSLGAYSYWGVGQYTAFAGAERERAGNCHFAGEHTSIDFQGYLNGAVESGERAASEILADVKAG